MMVFVRRRLFGATIAAGVKNADVFRFGRASS
jgi:hypothetical protein